MEWSEDLREAGGRSLFHEPMSAPDAAAPANKKDRERPAAEDERPAKRVKREYDYTSAWFFIVHEIKDDGAGYIKFTPRATPEAERLARFFYETTRVGVAVDDPMDEDLKEKEKKGSSSSSSSSSDSENAGETYEALGALQIARLAAEPTSKLGRYRWSKNLRAVDKDLRHMLKKKGLAAFGTFEVEYECETPHASWADGFSGNVRLLDATEGDRPEYKGDKDDKKHDRRRSHKRRASSDDDSD